MNTNKKDTKSRLFNLKLSEEDREILQKAADRYTRGNVSAWLKWAGKSFRPRKKTVFY